MTCFLWSSLVLLLLSSNSRSVHAVFTEPSGPDDSVHYMVGSNVVISWNGTDSYSILSLGLFQSSNQTISWLIENSVSYPTHVTWSVNIASFGFNIQSSNLFQFLIVNQTNFGAPMYSPWFTINEPSPSVNPSSTPSTGTTSSTGTTFTPSPQASATAPVPSPSMTDVNQGSRSSSLGPGAAAGIGVSLGVAVVAVVALAIIWRTSRKRSLILEKNAAEEPPMVFSKQHHYLPDARDPIELGVADDNGPIELSTARS